MEKKKDALQKALDRAEQDAAEEKLREEEAAKFAEEVRDDDLDLANVEIHTDMDSADVTAVDGDYGANQIQILEGLEAVRKRPGMYIGSTSERGLHHLVYEVVDNSIDEALAGYCDHIDVTIEKDNSITVVDNGRGIPVDMHESGMPAVEVVLTVLHAGGKFGGDGYKVSGGLHGVGVSVVNALSSSMDVKVRRDGKIYEISFTRGVTVEKLHEIGTSETTGTRVHFVPDPEIFTVTTYSFETLKHRLRELAFLNQGITIRLMDKRGEGREDKDGEEAMTHTASMESCIADLDLLMCSRNRSDDAEDRRAIATQRGGRLGRRLVVEASPGFARHGRDANHGDTPLVGFSRRGLVPRERTPEGPSSSAQDARSAAPRSQRLVRAAAG